MKKNAKKTYGVMLDHKERLAINEALASTGFDGNHRFSSITNALSKAKAVLDGFGIEEDQVLSAFEFSGPTGRSLIHLAFSNKKDPFSPTSIENSALAFYWHRFETGKYEVVAYVS